MVSKEKGENLARSQNIPFLETSAKTNYNIDDAFEKLARLILKKVSLLVYIIASWYVIRNFFTTAYVLVILFYFLIMMKS